MKQKVGKIQKLKPSYWKVPYRKYTWVGNQISEEDMASLHALKQKTRKPITVMVAEAVSQYLVRMLRNDKGGIKWE